MDPPRLRTSPSSEPTPSSFGRRRGAPDHTSLGQRLHRFFVPMPKPIGFGVEKYPYGLLTMIVSL